MIEMPYFMSDRSWYRFDFKTREFVLTERATKEAKDSYNEYIKMRNNAKNR